MIKKISRNEMRKVRHERVRNKIVGTAEVPRLCVFRSNKNISAQIIDDENGITLASASSLSLKLENGGNKEAATKVVFDRGGYLYHGRVEALATAAREKGLEF